MKFKTFYLWAFACEHVFLVMRHTCTLRCYIVVSLAYNIKQKLTLVSLLGVGSGSTNVVPEWDLQEFGHWSGWRPINAGLSNIGVLVLQSRGSEGTHNRQ